MDTSDTRFTRRHLLHATTLALTSSIAGCTDRTTNRNNPNVPSSEPPDSDNTEPDGPTNNVPEDPAAIFNGRNTRFSFFDLPYYKGHPDTFAPHPVQSDHPDNNLFTVTIEDETTARATLRNINVKRSIDIILNVRDKDGTYHERSTEINPKDNEDAFTTRELEFDISDISLPRGAGGFIELLADDSHPGFNTKSVLKLHQYVAIPYKNGTNWVNSETFNTIRYQNSNGDNIIRTPRGVNAEGASDSEPAGYIETRDPQDGNGEERIVFLAVRNTINGEVYGVSTHIKHSAYNNYQRKSSAEKWEYNQDYECYYATEISHFRELGEKTHTAIEKIGITNRREKLEALGDLLQMIPYHIHNGNPNVTGPLYQAKGDCTDKSTLFACISQQDEWNHLPAYIHCKISGIEHRTVGIDTSDVESLNPENNFTIRPSDNQIRNRDFPDTEYAFFDMTYDSSIGEISSNVEEPITIRAMGDYSKNPRHTIASDKPDY